MHHSKELDNSILDPEDSGDTLLKTLADPEELLDPAECGETFNDIEKVGGNINVCV